MIGFESQLHHLIAPNVWACYLTSHWLSFPISEMGTIKETNAHHCEGEMGYSIKNLITACQY